MPPTDPEFLLFVELVERMRAAQRSYFRSGNPEDLNKSKQLERDVDAAVTRAKAGPPPPALFSGGRDEA